MPTKREREYYRMGFQDGRKFEGYEESDIGIDRFVRDTSKPKPKRKLSAWNKFVKANSKKKIYQYANGKLKLKKMGIAFRKKKRR